MEEKSKKQPFGENFTKTTSKVHNFGDRNFRNPSDKFLDFFATSLPFFKLHNVYKGSPNSSDWWCNGEKIPFPQLCG